MTKRLEAVVKELEKMACGGNRHAVVVLMRVAEETSNRHDYAELRLAVLRARRGFRHWEEDCRDEAEACKLVRIDLAGRDHQYSVN